MTDSAPEARRALAAYGHRDRVYRAALSRLERRESLPVVLHDLRHQYRQIDRNILRPDPDRVQPDQDSQPWMQALRQACKERGQKSVAAALGLGRSTVGQTICGTYNASTRRVQDAVERILMGHEQEPTA